jgi:16S rRNA A1518/A1519 N6-dimethyltransferase RsmA/KsgA/DIM1 with predicted DNA glycosylase/AP lyase activity
MGKILKEAGIREVSETLRTAGINPQQRPAEIAPETYLALARIITGH